MSYTAFPVADFKTGLFTAKEAWLAPADAYNEFRNANIFRGRIKKRAGIKNFGWFPTRTDTITGITQANPAVVTTSGSHGLSNGDVVIIQSVTGMTEVNNNKYVVANKTATTFELQNEDSSGFTGYSSGGTVDQLKSITWKGSLAAVGVDQKDRPQVRTGSAHGLSTGNKVFISGEFQSSIGGMASIDGVQSAITVDSTTAFTLNDVDSTDFTAHTTGGDVFLVNESNSNAIVGVGEVYQDETDNIFIVMNQKRIAKYDSTLSNLIAVSTSDIFTGTSTDLFHVEPAFSKTWITNFKDNVYSYDGTTQTQEVFDIDGDGGASPTFGSHNDLDRCKFIFQYNRRLCLLYTVESGTKYPQRIRWSRIDFGAGTTSQWDDTADDTTAGSLDADTDEEIVTALFLRDTLVVFFERSIWALRKTGAVDFPFRWEKLSDHEGIFASRFGSLGHQQFAFAIGVGGLIATDGLQTKRADELIPDFEDEIDDSELDRIYMAKTISLREMWVAYSDTKDQANNKVKVLDYENGSWAQYDLSYNVMGEFTTENIAAKTWADFTIRPDDTWEATLRKWDYFAAPSGAPRNIIGDDSGQIYLIDSGTSDVGRKVELSVETARFNPFKDQGKAAALGFIDFLFTENSDTSVQIDLFNDFEDVPYSSQTVSLQNETSRPGIDKVWKRVYVDTIANSHKFKLSHNEAGQPFELHAMVPYFRPAGRMDYL